MEDAEVALGNQSKDTHARLSFECPEWRTFLLRHYRQVKKHDPHASLMSVYPIAKRKFVCRNKSCDVNLDLISNLRRHKRKDRD